MKPRIAKQFLKKFRYKGTSQRALLVVFLCALLISVVIFSSCQLQCCSIVQYSNLLNQLVVACLYCQYIYLNVHIIFSFCFCQILYFNVFLYNITQTDFFSRVISSVYLFFHDVLTYSICYSVSYLECCNFFAEGFKCLQCLSFRNVFIDVGSEPYI